MQLSLAGLDLHTRVPPDRWCVTREDLQKFRRLVQDSVQKGDVRPTELDPFDLMDQTIGPSVHTVVDQLIKPVTHQSGDASWALMLHPDGLQCDLYVTHSWQEGIYEFTDNVLGSWPSGSKHAYCCMLSNPQNLDISKMITCPRRSPFAQNLHSADYMLVVPNRRCSIYTRIWCVYEAYLAESAGKTIYTAAPKIDQFWFQLLQVVGTWATGICVAVSALLLVHQKGQMLDSATSCYLDIFVRSLLFPLAFYIHYGHGAELRTRFVSLCFAHVAGCEAGLWLGAAIFDITAWFDGNDVEKMVMWPWAVLKVVWSLLMGLAGDATRQWSLAAEGQACALAMATQAASWMHKAQCSRTKIVFWQK